MNYETLDFYFPFIVLAYGVTMMAVLHIPMLVKLADQELHPYLRKQLLAHRTLAVICLAVGAIWSLQNIWYS